MEQQIKIQGAVIMELEKIIEGQSGRGYGTTHISQTPNPRSLAVNSNTTSDHSTWGSKGPSDHPTWGSKGPSDHRLEARSPLPKDEIKHENITRVQTRDPKLQESRADTSGEPDVNILDDMLKEELAQLDKNDKPAKFDNTIPAIISTSDTEEDDPTGRRLSGDDEYEIELVFEPEDISSNVKNEGRGDPNTRERIIQETQNRKKKI
jgi:hypothetical protein